MGVDYPEAMTPVPATLRPLPPRIDAATRAELTHLLHPLARTDAAAPLVDAALSAIEGGKRLRGMCAFLGAAIGSGLDPEQAHVDTVAAALELYQASALAHDDVIDHADTRRGRPTPHIALARVHRESGWSGDADDFGRSAAILLGDLLLSAADHAVTRAGEELGEDRSRALLERFTLMHTEVALGQYLDIRAEQIPLDAEDAHCVDLDEVLSVVRLKSARYSVVHPTVMGMICVGATHREIADVESVLEPWGTAFQLRDDDLGVFRDPSTTGKPAGDDLREGKRTALVATAWAEADAEGRATIARTLGRRDLAGSDLEDLTHLVAVLGRPHNEAMIAALLEEGRRALESSCLEAPARALLEELGSLLVHRSA